MAVRRSSRTGAATSCGSIRSWWTSSDSNGSRPRRDARPPRGSHRTRRVKPWRCSAALRSPTWPTSRSRPPRSAGSRTCARRRGSWRSTRTSPPAAIRRSSGRSRRCWPSIRCASACTHSACSRCIALGARPMRWRRFATRGGCSWRRSAWSRAATFAACTRPSCATIPRSSSRRPSCRASSMWPARRRLSDATASWRGCASAGNARLRATVDWLRCSAATGWARRGWRGSSPVRPIAVARRCCMRRVGSRLRPSPSCCSVPARRRGRPCSCSMTSTQRDRDGRARPGRARAHRSARAGARYGAGAGGGGAPALPRLARARAARRRRRPADRPPLRPRGRARRRAARG